MALELLYGMHLSFLTCNQFDGYIFVLVHLDGYMIKINALNFNAI